MTSEKISKRLNILTDIVETRRDFTVDEVLNFAYIAVFVKTDAKEIMEKIVILFSRFPKIDPDLKIDLHQVLKKMILYHFQDDLNKAKELLCLITINFTSKEVDRMNSYEREIYAKDQEITRITEEKDREISRITEDYQEMSRLTEEKDQEISRITEDYREMSRLTEEKDQEISRLTEELNKLKMVNRVCKNFSENKILIYHSLFFNQCHVYALE